MRTRSNGSFVKNIRGVVSMASSHSRQKRTPAETGHCTGRRPRRCVRTTSRGSILPCGWRLFSSLGDALVHGWGSAETRLALKANAPVRIANAKVFPKGLMQKQKLCTEGTECTEENRRIVQQSVLPWCLTVSMTEMLCVVLNSPGCGTKGQGDAV